MPGKASRKPTAPRAFAAAHAKAGLALTASLLALGTAAPASADSAAPEVRMIQQSTLDPQALYFVSYDGLVNSSSYQQSGILTHGGFQYAAWYTADRSAVVARRALGTTRWETVALPHRLSVDDSHNTISLGISPQDDRLHVAMDTHNNPVHYFRSKPGLAAGRGAWQAEAFGPLQRTLEGVDVGSMTYPRFVVAPNGKLQLSYRTGQGSGNGVLELAEYDGAWHELGSWTSSTGDYSANGGTSTTRNMYLHGLTYGPRGRLHAAFTWREGDNSVLCDPGGLTNHDTGYAYSDDQGRTWRNNTGEQIATTGTDQRVSISSPGHVVRPSGVDHALINQESQAVDSTGRPHVLVSRVPEDATDCVTDFTAQRRSQGRVYHQHREADGRWVETQLPVPLEAFGRTRIGFDRDDNAYAVMPYGRILTASKASGWTDWTLRFDPQDFNAFGEVLVDDTRAAKDGVISVMYQQRSQGTTPSPIAVADFRLERGGGRIGNGPALAAGPLSGLTFERS
ncbi:BNR repeat-containing protein [Saccharopolyspora mangrovi]|uniref:BNR repeat-containing protein n=1 Tax=Saccharopolyspora mangrovi TaxID=3082379 RepID=A0ABU6ABI6_9PSEU|nr:BNR repeat-containing protein [Saccharopolyspora sp. S2-29]MEB3368933.1 BNR repeat-containing protein [Saccharopolyspora sp. S2-29]